MIGFPLVISVSERDMPGIEPGPLGWHTSALTNELQEVFIAFKFNCEGVWAWLVICYLAESISPKLELPRKGFDFPTSGETLPCAKSFNSKISLYFFENILLSPGKLFI